MSVQWKTIKILGDYSLVFGFPASIKSDEISAYLMLNKRKKRTLKLNLC